MDDTTTPTPQTNSTPPQTSPFQQPKKSKAGKVILMILLVLVLIAGGVAAGWYVGKMEKDKAVEDAKSTAKQEALQDAAKDTKEPEPQSSAQAKTTNETTCNADELSLSMKASSESGAGTLAYELVFKNTSQRTCILGGFPGVSLVNENGNMIGSPADRAKNYEEKKLTLAPGKEVMATLSVSNSTNFDAGECKEGAAKLRVYPPNDTGYLSVASSPITSWCPGFMTSPVLSM